ncbi:helix-turn-helix transcriptional regulator [Actinophytocola sp.]|uniref:helix-turn-helix transcriptional regulator n=1 Tax=Actinophytocola sp. TaxID=1872138 RepID=UPI002ED0BF8A
MPVDSKVGTAPLVGRSATVRSFMRMVEATSEGEFQFLALVGEPGVGKTRLLGELASRAGAQGLTTLWGRAAEFEQVMPFSALVDALDDHLESSRGRIAGRFGAAQRRLLATVFPALTANSSEVDLDEHADRDGIARLRLYRALRQLVDELAAPDGLALLLDDVHWADPGSAEFLDHLVRHPPRGRVLVAVAYRPAQAPPRVAALVAAAGGHQITVAPLTPDEVAEFLGEGVSRARGRALYEASGGNPFYLEALARMQRLEGAELPASVRAVLQVELGDLSSDSLRLAHAAAVAGDEFEPALMAVAAEMPEAALLTALNDLVARDILRQATSGRFRFRHPLVRQAAYEYAEAGWRLGAHARLAAHLARVGAPATVQAHHVERSCTFGDQQAITTLVTAARAVAAHAPETCAHWLRIALGLLPVEPGTLEQRLELLMELCRALSVSGRLAEGRDTARELLALLPADQYARRARAARICAVMERQLDRPHEARALLLDELSRMPNPRADAAIPLRMRLVVESLMRVDFRAAQAVLDLMPDSGEGWEPGLDVAVAALRPMSAYAAGRIADAQGLADTAERLVGAAADSHLAEWLDTMAWLCWADTCLGRYPVALKHFDRSAGLARSTGQAYVETNLLAGKARTLIALGRLPDALATVEESIDGARLIGSGQQLVFALTQRCLALAWSGDHDAALAVGEDAVTTVVGSHEVWGYMAQNARGVAMIAAGRLDEGVEALIASCADFKNPKIDRATLVATCELLAQVETAQGRDGARWAEMAADLDDPGLPVFTGLVTLARAHVTRPGDPAAAAALAEEAASRLTAGQRRLDIGRALLTAGLAHEEAGRADLARARLREATDIFLACGAAALAAQTVREQRRLGVRVPAPAAAGRTGSHGLSPRELEIARLVTQGLTNQKIAAELYLSVRTVETHLSRVFAKLGVTSRAGVAAMLARES